MTTTLALALLLALAPAVQEAQAPATDRRVPPTPWPELSFDPSAVDYAAVVDPIGASAVTDLHVPGLTIAVMVAGELVYERGYGHANLELEVPAGPETVYRIGSVTKQFTAAAIMGLVEDGKLALDDDVREHLEWVDTGEHTVTVRQLLDHTSGIPSYTDLGWDWLQHLRDDVTPEVIWSWVADRDFDFEPGTDWHYNNTGYVLLGAILKAVGRRSPRMLLMREVTKPLGLPSIAYDHYKTVVPHRADGYGHLPFGHVNADFVSMTQPAAAGAIIATAGDLLRWQHALVSGRVVSPASYAAMTSATTLADGRTTGYGFGLAPGSMDGLVRVNHGGGVMGFSAMLAHYPDVDLGVCVLTNLAGVDADGLERSVARQVLGLSPPLDVDLPLDPADRDALVGSFKFLHYDLVLSVEDDQLVRRIPERDDTARPLRHRGELAFGLDDDPSLLIRFQRGADGAIDRVTVEERGRVLVGVRAD